MHSIHGDTAVHDSISHCVCFRIIWCSYKRSAEVVADTMLHETTEVAGRAVHTLDHQCEQHAHGTPDESTRSNRSLASCQTPPRPQRRVLSAVVQNTLPRKLAFDLVEAALELCRPARERPDRLADNDGGVAAALSGVVTTQAHDWGAAHEYPIDAINVLQNSQKNMHKMETKMDRLNVLAGKEGARVAVALPQEIAASTAGTTLTTAESDAMKWVKDMAQARTMIEEWENDQPDQPSPIKK